MDQTLGKYKTATKSEIKWKKIVNVYAKSLYFMSFWSKYMAECALMCEVWSACAIKKLLLEKAGNQQSKGEKWIA